MESTQDLENVGGVTKVVIYPTGTPLPEIGEEEGCSEACVVAIMEKGSSYSETWLCENSSRVVTHSLSIVTFHDAEICDESQIDNIIRRGITADVTLATGAVIRVGEDDDEDGRYALRLKSVTTLSGSEPLDIPSKTWVWESKDSTPLI